jgi:hypothetical protein
MPDKFAETKDAIFRNWVRESRGLRSALQDAVSKIDKRLSRDVFDEELKGVLQSQQTRLSNLAKGDLRNAFLRIDREIQAGIDRAIIRAARPHLLAMRKAGIPPMTQSKYMEIRKEVLELLEKPFPKGSGLSYMDRIRLIQRQHERQLEDVLSNRHLSGNGPAKVRQNIRDALTFAEEGTPVRGGSAVKKLRRIMISEESRLASEMERRILDASGVQFGYWRLSPEHKWEGGSEICEIYAASTGEDVESAIRKLPRDSQPQDLDGLYLMDTWPEYPHPFCKCHMEPLIIVL